MLTERFFPIWGGAENQLRQLLPYLVQRGHHVEVITRRWRKELPLLEHVNGITIQRVGIPGEGRLSTLFFVFLLFWQLIKERASINITHTHGAVAMAAIGSFFASICRKKNISKIASAGRIPKLKKNVGGKLLLFWFKRCDAIICMSDEILSELTDIGVSLETICHIKNAVNASRFKPLCEEKKKEWRLERGFEVEAPVIVFTGRLVTRKGLNVLIDAWKSIIKKNPQAQLLIIGSGDLQPNSIEDKIRARVKSEGIKNIHFEGSTSSPETYLGAADIFAFPSRQEGFPNALLEAMACGLAAVVTEIGGVVDLVENGKNGLFIPTGDCRLLSDRIQYLISHPRERMQISRNAREHVLNNFTFDRVAGEYCQLYENIYK